MKKIAVVLSIAVAAVALAALMLSVASAAPSAPVQPQDFGDRVVFTKTTSTGFPILGEIFTFTLQFHTTTVETQTVYVRVTDHNPNDSYLKIITESATIGGGAWYSLTIDGIVWEGEFGPSTTPDDVTFQVQVTGIPTTALASGYLITNTAMMIDLTGAGTLPSGTAKAAIRIMPMRIFLPLVVHGYPPVWKQGGNTDNVRFHTPSGCGSDAWYAGTPDAGVVGVWKSTDSAQIWTKIDVALSPDPYPVVANPNDPNCNQAFVSVWGPGIYHITDDAAEPVNDGLGETYVYALAITGTTLYAGTDSMGIYKTDIDTIAWRDVNIGIDEDRRRIRSLTVIGNRVYAGARACTLYVSYDEGESWPDRQIVLTDGCNDAQIWSIAEVNGVRYAGLGQGKGLYYNSGSGWQKVGAIDGYTVYGLAYDGANGYLYVSTYGSGIYRCRVSETGMVQDCPHYNPGLTTLNMREIKIHDELLVAGSDDGIWYLPLFR